MGDGAEAAVRFDAKADAAQVERSLSTLQAQLESKANYVDLNNAVQDLDTVNATLAQELCLGRWIWNSGRTKDGNFVPWNVQTACTQPHNFLWKKNNARIVAVAPGLYEVVFGFFSKKKPTVQLMLNGEPCLSAINSASQLLHHSSSRLANVQHPAGNVTGLTLIDFLALPARAKLYIVYTGDSVAEGFISLKSCDIGGRRGAVVISLARKQHMCSCAYSCHSCVLRAACLPFGRV